MNLENSLGRIALSHIVYFCLFVLFIISYIILLFISKDRRIFMNIFIKIGRSFDLMSDRSLEEENLVL